MVLPLLAGSIGAIYSVGKGLETARYWRDYKKNTGYSSKYPFKSGQYDWMKGMSTSTALFGFGLKNFDKIPKAKESKFQTYGRSVQYRLR